MEDDFVFENMAALLLTGKRAVYFFVIMKKINKKCY
ncbi:hypothetical protein BDD39_002893 [Saccharococcus thermophilus]|uniref:Uncharacterized protein n=1 Tax=Saccharococcus thermophilus TaxID=29396 RepID=A0A846ML94_9BACL|nr:hypothetical protein [Saccharococcus thermophilus]